MELYSLMRSLSTYRRNSMENVAIKFLSVFSNIGEVALVLVILTDAVHIFNLMFANNILENNKIRDISILLTILLPVPKG